MKPTHSHLNGGSHELGEAPRRQTYHDGLKHPHCLVPGSRRPLSTPARDRKSGVSITECDHKGPGPAVVQTRPNVQRISKATRDTPAPAKQHCPEPRPAHHIRKRPEPRVRKEGKPEVFTPVSHRPAQNIIRPGPRPSHLQVDWDGEVSRPPTSAGITVVMHPNRMSRLPGSQSRAKVECVNRKGQKLLDRLKIYLRRSCEKLMSVC